MSKDRYKICQVIAAYECITSLPSWQNNKRVQCLCAGLCMYHYLIYVVCTLTSGSSYRRSLLCIHRKFAASVVYHTALVITDCNVRRAAYPKFWRWEMGSNAFGHILSIRIFQWMYFSKWNETGWRLQLLGKACVNVVVISLKCVCKLSDYNTGQEQVSVRLLCFQTVTAETGIWQVPGSKPHRWTDYWRFYSFSAVPCEWCNSL